MARGFTDAADNYLSYGFALSSAYPLSFSCWFYPTVKDVDHYALVTMADTAVVNQWLGLYPNSLNSVNMSVRNVNGYSATTTTMFNLNTWNHTLGVLESSTSRYVYLNGGGKATDTNTCAFPTGLDNTIIGALIRTTTLQTISSRVAEVAIWSVALGDVEAVALAAGISPLAVRPQSLVAYWPLFTDADIDIVGGYDLTDYNSPTVADHPPVVYTIPPLMTPYQEPASGNTLLVLDPRMGKPEVV